MFGWSSSAIISISAFCHSALQKDPFSSAFFQAERFHGVGDLRYAMYHPHHAPTQARPRVMALVVSYTSFTSRSKVACTIFRTIPLPSVLPRSRKTRVAGRIRSVCTLHPLLVRVVGAPLLPLGPSSKLILPIVLLLLGDKCGIMGGRPSGSGEPALSFSFSSPISLAADVKAFAAAKRGHAPEWILNECEPLHA